MNKDTDNRATEKTVKKPLNSLEKQERQRITDIFKQKVLNNILNKMKK